MLLLLENKIRGGISSVMDDRHVVSDVNKQILYIDANNLYGCAMSQYLPTCEFEKTFLPNNYPLDQIVEYLSQLPVDNESGFSMECHLEYPVEIKRTTEIFPLCPYQVEANCELFSDFMNFIKQPKYKPT